MRATGNTTTASVARVEQDLADAANVEHAAFVSGYFKTGAGQYGEGDQFLGIRMPVLRTLAKRHESLDLPGCSALLGSPYHEARLLALLILVRKYERGDDTTRDAVYRLYLENIRSVNNWDLVDLSAPHIVGSHLHTRDRSLLRELARSDSVWERRIAILATQRFIKAGDYADTFRIADLLLSDPHDLIHKAVGWMLREVGQKDRAAEEAFLLSRYARMPRTMLRYAIEKFPEPRRQQYLRGEIP